MSRYVRVWPIALALALVSALFVPPTTAHASPADGSYFCNADTTGNSGSFEVSNAIVTSQSNCVGAVVIPDGVTSIASWVFEFAGITSLTLANSVNTISTGAFGCDGNLTSVSIGTGLTTIGSDAFGNSGLTSLSIPANVTTIGAAAFFADSSLATLDLGTGVTVIGNGAFDEASALTTVTIPDSVTAIGSLAFANEPHITSINFGTGLTQIGDYAFAFDSALLGVTLPDSLNSMGNGVFEEDSGITSFSINNGLTSIGSGTFYNVNNLTTYHYCGSYLHQAELNDAGLGNKVGTCSSPQSIAVVPGPSLQNALIISAGLSTIHTMDTISLSTSGGSGDGTVSFQDLTPEICAVTPSGSVIGIAVGTCRTTATKAAMGVFLPITSEPFSLKVTDVGLSQADKEAADKEAADKEAADKEAAIKAGSKIRAQISNKTIASLTIKKPWHLLLDFY